MSSFIVFPDRIKVCMDVSSADHGLAKWMRILREKIQEPFGLIDEYQQQALSKPQFQEYVQRVRYPRYEDTLSNINKLFHGTTDLNAMCCAQL
eukprot:376499_1